MIAPFATHAPASATAGTAPRPAARSCSPSERTALANTMNAVSTESASAASCAHTAPPGTVLDGASRPASAAKPAYEDRSATAAAPSRASRCSGSTLASAGRTTAATPSTNASRAVGPSSRTPASGSSIASAATAPSAMATACRTVPGPPREERERDEREHRRQVQRERPGLGEHRVDRAERALLRDVDADPVEGADQQELGQRGHGQEREHARERPPDRALTRDTCGRGGERHRAEALAGDHPRCLRNPSTTTQRNAPHRTTIARYTNGQRAWPPSSPERVGRDVERHEARDRLAAVALLGRAVPDGERHVGVVVGGEADVPLTPDRERTLEHDAPGAITPSAPARHERRGVGGERAEAGSDQVVHGRGPAEHRERVAGRAARRERVVALERVHVHVAVRMQGGPVTLEPSRDVGLPRGAPLPDVHAGRGVAHAERRHLRGARGRELDRDGVREVLGRPDRAVGLRVGPLDLDVHVLAVVHRSSGDREPAPAHRRHGLLGRERDVHLRHLVPERVPGLSDRDFGVGVHRHEHRLLRSREARPGDRQHHREHHHRA